MENKKNEEKNKFLTLKRGTSTNSNDMICFNSACSCA